MNSNILIIIFITMISSSAMAMELKSQYTFGTLNFGASKVESDIQGEVNKETGYLYGLGIGHEFKFDNNYNFNIGLDYSKHKLETELTYKNYSKVYLKSEYTNISLNPTYSFGLVDLGIKADIVVGNDGILVTQSESIKTLVGVNAYYNMPFKNNKMRFGLALQKGLGDSNYTQAVAMVQYSFGWTKPVKTIKKRVKKESVTVISFGENLISFENDIAELDSTSKAFLAELGTFLNNNLRSWKSLKIVGHTSKVGESDYNKYLSYKRANSVYNVFKEIGLPEHRIKVLGKGETQPLTLDKNKSHLNRRVEMKFLKMKNGKEFRELIKKLMIKYNLKNQ